MTRTRPATLVLLAVAGGVVAWAVQSWLVSDARPMAIPPYVFAITLVLVAIVVLVLAWPVRQYTQRLRRALDAERAAREGRALRGDDYDGFGDRDPGSADAEGRASGADALAGAHARADRAAKERRVNPFQAVRVLALARASSLAGSMLAGATAGTLLFVLTRTFIPEQAVWQSGTALAASVVLVIAGLVAESWCSLPPESGARASDPVPPVTAA